MVLVAAIAAGVLINTAGFLQTKSEQTGQEASAQVSNRVVVTSAYGNVANDRVEFVNLSVMRGAGSDDINLSTATVEWIGPDTATTLVGSNSTIEDEKHLIDPNSDQFEISPIRNPSNSVPVLSSQDDRFRLSINTAHYDDDSKGLQEGETATVKITTQYGAVTVYQVTIPSSLSQKTAVSV